MNASNKGIEKPSFFLWWKTSLSEILRLNAEGIECLQTLKVESAIELFQDAIDKDNRMNIELKEKLVYISCTAEARDCGATTTVAFNHGNNCCGMDYFVRQDNRNSSRDEDMVFCEPIRLPSTTLDFPFIIFWTRMNQQERNPSLELWSGWISTFMKMMTICHTYNLALSNHLRGLELLCEQRTQGSFRSLLEQRQLLQHHLKFARHFYQFVFDVKRTVSQRILNWNNKNDNKIFPDIIGFIWFDPRIELACLNNLADVHYREMIVRDIYYNGRSDDIDEECRNLYRELLSFARNLWGVVQDSTEERFEETRVLMLSYLQIFARNAQKGCFRIWRNASRSRRSHLVPVQTQSSSSSTITIANSVLFWDSNDFENTNDGSTSSSSSITRSSSTAGAA